MFVLVWLSAAAMLPAQQPNVHYWHQGIMPPGAIGSRQLQRGGPLLGFFQPVEIRAPRGALVSLAADNQFDPPQSDPRKAGMLIGSVYRMRVTNIPMAEGRRCFPPSRSSTASTRRWARSGVSPFPSTLPRTT